MSRPEVTRTPNLRIHAECSSHLSYHGQTFAVPCFSCDQAALRPSVTPFFILCSHHHIIMKFSGVITNDQSKFRTVTPVWIHIWCWNDAHSFMLLRRGALLFFKVICQISRSHGSKKHKAWSSIKEVPYCFWRSSVKFQGHTALKTSNLTQIGRFRTVTPVWIHQWLWNDTPSLK